jgi:hypothetical protein
MTRTGLPLSDSSVPQLPSRRISQVLLLPDHECPCQSFAVLPPFITCATIAQGRASVSIWPRTSLATFIRNGEARSVGVDYSYGKQQRGFQEIHAEKGIYESHIMLFISIGYIDGVSVIPLEQESGTINAFNWKHRKHVNSNLD